MGDDSPERNSSVALRRLQAMLDAVVPGADRQLPPERALAAEIGVSRRALRRALEVLEVEGRIWRRQGSGTFTERPLWAPPAALRRLSDRTNILEVMQARRQLEPGLAAMAATRADAAVVATLERLAQQTAISADADARELWDGALHRAIAEAAGNTLLLALFDVVNGIRQDAAWRHRREGARSPTRLTLYLAQHETIIGAIARGDAIGAETAMRAHLDALEASLEQVEEPADAR